MVSNRYCITDEHHKRKVPFYGKMFCPICDNDILNSKVLHNWNEVSEIKPNEKFKIVMDDDGKGCDIVDISKNERIAYMGQLAFSKGYNEKYSQILWNCGFNYVFDEKESY